MYARAHVMVKRMQENNRKFSKYVHKKTEVDT